MIITITKDDGTISYDVNAIEDENLRANASVMISKVSQLEVITEALSFASATHRGNLEVLLQDVPEAIVKGEGDTDTDEVDVEQGEEESLETDS